MIFLWKRDQTSTCDLPRAATTFSLGATAQVREQELCGSAYYLRQHKGKWAPLTTAESGQPCNKKRASCSYGHVPCVAFRNNKLALVVCQQFTCGVVLEFLWNQINQLVFFPKVFLVLGKQQCMRWFFPGPNYSGVPQFIALLWDVFE